MQGTITVQLCLYLGGEAFLQGCFCPDATRVFGGGGGAVLQCRCCPAAADLQLLGAAAASCQLQAGNGSLIEHFVLGRALAITQQHRTSCARELTAKVSHPTQEAANLGSGTTAFVTVDNFSAHRISARLHLLVLN